MTSKPRASSGCWTCRLRHKKCDESPGVCSTCVSRGIQCDGYGERPVWMDGGEIESGKLESIKETVRESASRKRRQLQGNKSTGAHTMTSQGASWRRSHVSSNSRISFSLHSELDIVTPDSGPAGTLSPENETIEDRHFENLIGEHWNFTTGLSPVSSATDLNSSNLSLHAPFTPSFDHTPRDFAELAVQSTFKLSELSSPPCRLREASTLVYYFRHGFEHQSQFFGASNFRELGWLFLLLESSKTFYYSTLCLGEHIRIDNGDDTSCLGDSPLSMANNHYTRALEGLREQLDKLKSTEYQNSDTKVILVPSLLATIMQLMIFETMNENYATWQMHLSAANRLLSEYYAEIQSTFRENKFFSRFTGPSNEPLSEQDQKSKEFAYLAAVAYRFLVKFFFWSNNISSAYLRLTDGIITPLPLHQIFDIDSERRDECRPWVLAAIGEISNLNAWKVKSLNEGTLDIMDLVSQASKIQERLEVICGNRGTVVSPKTHEYQKGRIITCIFASAALTYLHVVVSGAYATFPGIQKRIQNTTGFLDLLQPQDMPPMLAWPLCIAGSMASGETQQYFLDLEQKLNGISASTAHHLLKALRVARTCWQMRGAGDIEVDWSNAILNGNFMSILI